MALTKLADAALPEGAILQVKRTIKTDTGSFSSANTDTYVDIPGMSVAITPLSTSSDILVFWSINISQSTTATQHS